MTMPLPTQPSASSGFWLQNKMLVVSHPPHLPNLTPCDFILPMDEERFEREAFADVAEVQQASLAALDSITVEHFRQCF